MTHPEGEPFDIEAIEVPESGTKPSAGGGELDTDFERIVPLAAQYDLIKTTDEEAQRDQLLKFVTVDEHGIARSTNLDSNVTISLVAVRIQNHDATVIPLELDEQGLVMPLPGETGSQIGFFVGHDGYTEMAAVIRQGEYPGIPLVTQTVGNERQKEILTGMEGVKASEKDEARWAEQIGLYDSLGFDPYKTRGIFSKSHREDPNSTQWKSQRLVVVPDSMRDLVEHHDAFDVTKDSLQVMTYGIQPVQTIPQWRPAPYTFGGGFDTFGGATRSEGLGIGFGNEFTQQARTERIELKGITSAFQTRVVPQE